MAGALGSAGWAAPLGHAAQLCILPLLPIVIACSDLKMQHFLPKITVLQCFLSY